ncbi:type II toxin-antitoxin system HicA family toxin [aff. Roholtiella sp. LEGE 12411]|uniref:type II toxin-antitoxin system HicA family toxin n=1 Tax=aff. Roholtiella sp. LEGE 12411 TaxID=1828822 RepID=UPI00187F4838|nr:type II toxin-antitoxin system HicA family toxin [aff. Roholtiella sp. LEGE 12411]MBE9036150.1 type II toxin-antitoxin system HicA family toxin [aff. Roholtiella sp. LEGE 12411]
MSRLTPVSWRDLVKRLQELGFEGPYAGGKHPQMRRGDVTVIITNSHEGDISVGLLSRLLRQAGVSREEWLGE